jgi:hypothetical protein
MENFPRTRLGNVGMPVEAKPMMDHALLSNLTQPQRKRCSAMATMADSTSAATRHGCFWEVAVAETRSLIADGWA